MCFRTAFEERIRLLYRELLLGVESTPASIFQLADGSFDSFLMECREIDTLKSFWVFLLTAVDLYIS